MMPPLFRFLIGLYHSILSRSSTCDILISETTRRNQYGEIHPLRKAFQEGKAQARPGQTPDLGQPEPRHPKAGE